MIKPTPILSRYMIRQFIFSFFAILFIIMGFVLLFDIIELLRRTATKEDVSIGTIFAMGIMKLPNMIYVLLPFAVMLGSMVTFWRLTKSRELVIIRSAGVSVWEFLFPIIFITLAIGILNVTLFNPLAAVMYKKYENYEDKLMLRHASPFVLSHQGLWLREARDDGYSLVHARSVRQDGHILLMRDISIMAMQDNGELLYRIDADLGKLFQQKLELEKGTVVEVGKPNKRFENKTIATTLTIERIQENFASPETMSFWEIPAFIKFFEAAGFSTARHKLYFYSLIASPLLLCAMVLIASVFSLNPNIRRGKILFKITAGIATGFAFYFFSRLTFALGISGTIPIQMAAWSPAAISILFAISFLLHFEDG
ncbi:MAG: LPS export ABC transporter permease LptG [Alphaproteobacteria bacterium]